MSLGTPGLLDGSRGARRSWRKDRRSEGQRALVLGRGPAWTALPSAASMALPAALPLALLVLLVGGLGDATPARAGGFSIPLIGGRAATRFAFVARPDDTSAIYHNPAGLSLLGPYQIEMSGLGILSYSRYSRCSTTTFDAAGNATGCGLSGDGHTLFEPAVETTKYDGGALPYPRGFGILPYLGMTGRFGLRRWNFGLAIYSPQNATGSFPDCQRDSSGRPVDCGGAPQRFHAMLGTINTLYISPSVSFEPHPAISFGMAFSAVRAAITLERSLWLGGPDSTVAVLDDGWNGEGRVRLSASTWSWAFTLGAMWNLGETFDPGNRWIKGLRFGISYSSQTKFTFRDDMSLYSPLLYTFAQENDGCHRGNEDQSEVVCKAKATFRFPMQVRFGLDWEITREWDVGLDVFWQNYNIYKEIRIAFPTPLTLDIPGGDPVSVDSTVEPKDSFNVWAVALGSTYSPRWAAGLEIRAGLMWDQSPYPNRTYTLLNPDADKLGISFGLGYRFPFGLEVAAGYVALLYKDRIVRDSEIRPRICEPDDVDCQALAPDADFTMNGDVRNKVVHLFALHVGWRFGGGKPPLEPWGGKAAHAASGSAGVSASEAVRPASSGTARPARMAPAGTAPGHDAAPAAGTAPVPAPPRAKAPAPDAPRRAASPAAREGTAAPSGQGASRPAPGSGGEPAREPAPEPRAPARR